MGSGEFMNRDIDSLKSRIGGADGACLIVQCFRAVAMRYPTQTMTACLIRGGSVMRTKNITVGEDTPTGASLREYAAQPVEAAVASEAKGPKTETDPLGPIGRKRRCSDGPQPKKQNLPRHREF